jgi:hypothetical protein
LKPNWGVKKIMKRKLIDIDVINGLEKRSINVALKEINEAAELLAAKLKVESLTVHCINENEVTFVTPDANYVHASYKVDNQNLLLENIKELVVNEESQRVASLQSLSNMIENLIEDKNDSANENFISYVNLPLNRKIFRESIKDNKKKIIESKEVEKINEFSEFSKNVNKRKINEWKAISENISELINFKKGSPLETMVKVNEDDSKNIVSLKLPVLKVRNESKILSFDWDTPKTDVTYQRSKMKKVVKEAIFAKAMNDLRHANAVSDVSAMETTLENIVGAWPNIVYFTQKELSSLIKEALDTVNAHNYDDSTCEFMADAILRTAHNIYEDRVAKVFKAAGLENSKEYEKFAEVSEAIYPKLDEDYRRELTAFHDAFVALQDAHVVASHANDKIVKARLENVLESIENILNKKKNIDFSVLEEANYILTSIVEANIPMAEKDWHVSDKVHTSLNGSNPYTDKLAKVDAFPAKYNGDWKSSAPVSDGKSYSGNLDSEMSSAHTSGGKNIFPDLSNPYILKDEKPQIHDDSPNVIDGDNLATNQSGDTWPKLSNPYLPKNGMTLDQSFKHLSDSEK